MSDERKPHPKNVPGPFYVENGCCLMCLGTRVQAPFLIGFDEVEGHCFVKQQPQSDEETYNAIRAVWAADVECLRYRGHDPDIQRRLVQIGRADSCDHPLPTYAIPILRNHVTFTTDFANEAWDVAIALMDYLLSMNTEHLKNKVTQPRREGRVFKIDISWSEDKFLTMTIDRGEAATDRWLIHHSETWELASVGLSLVLDDWLRDDPRFSDLRWYTSDAWEVGDDDWQELPY